MSRDKTVKFYTTEEHKEWLTDQAEATNQSLSEYCHELIAECIEDDRKRKQYTRYGVDQQIELVINEIRDEVTSVLNTFEAETGPKLELLQRIQTVYAIAVWRLIKEDYPPAKRKAAMKHGVEHAGLNPSEDPEIQSVMPSTDLPPSTSESEQSSATRTTTTSEDSE